MWRAGRGTLRVWLCCTIMVPLWARVAHCRFRLRSGGLDRGCVHVGHGQSRRAGALPRAFGAAAPVPPQRLCHRLMPCGATHAQGHDATPLSLLSAKRVTDGTAGARQDAVQCEAEPRLVECLSDKAVAWVACGASFTMCVSETGDTFCFGILPDVV